MRRTTSIGACCRWSHEIVWWRQRIRWLHNNIGIFSITSLLTPAKWSRFSQVRVFWPFSRCGLCWSSFGWSCKSDLLNTIKITWGDIVNNKKTKWQWFRMVETYIIVACHSFPWRSTRFSWSTSFTRSTYSFILSSSSCYDSKPNVKSLNQRIIQNIVNEITTILLAGVFLVDLVGVPATLVPLEDFKGVFFLAEAALLVDGVRGASFSGVFVGLGILVVLWIQPQELKAQSLIFRTAGQDSKK